MAMATLDLLATLHLSTLPASPMPPLAESEKRYEVIDGELKEKPPMGAKANRMATILARSLDLFADENNLGYVFTMECAYQIFPHNPKQTRRPDISFIPAGRISSATITDSSLLVPPDLAVEVVSTNDLALDLEERINDYQLAGVRLIWLVYPSTQAIYVLRLDGSAARLTDAQQLSGEDVVPGFSCPLRKLFGWM